MIRLVTALWMILVLGGGVGLYLLKHEVQAMESRLAELRRQTYSDQQAIHVLRAEWTYLNEPARLKSLAQRHLGMEPMSATQVAMIADLPRREVIGPQMPLPGGDPISPPAAAPLPDKAKMIPAAAVPPRPVPSPSQGTGIKAPQKQATPPPARGPALAGSAQYPPELAEAR